MATSNPDAVTVRGMHSGDWDAVRAIYQQGIDTGEATFETEVRPAEYLDTYWLAGQRWVAELDGTVVGWAAAAPVSPRPCYRGVAETSVYVAAKWWGRGLGRTLVARQIAEAERAGLWTLQTSIFPENLTSIALHHRLGFRTVGTRERIAMLRGRWRDTVLLERRTNPGGHLHLE